jgi:hypothetical protein
MCDFRLIGQDQTDGIAYWPIREDDGLMANIKEIGHTGARTQDHSVISTALYRLSYTTWYFIQTHHHTNQQQTHHTTKYDAQLRTGSYKTTQKTNSTLHTLHSCIDIHIQAHANQLARITNWVLTLSISDAPKPIAFTWHVHYTASLQDYHALLDSFHALHQRSCIYLIQTHS